MVHDTSDPTTASRLPPPACSTKEGDAGFETPRGREKQGQSELSVTTALPQTIGHLTYLLDLSFREEGSVVPPDVLAVSLAELTAAVASAISTVWVAWSHNPSPHQAAHPVGMIEVRYGSTPPIGPHYLIGRLVVDPSYRNGMVARSLIQAAILGIPDENALLLTSVLGPMRRSYRRLGAREVGSICAGTLEDVRGRLLRG